MTSAQRLQCQKQIEMIATLVREMPLEEFVNTTLDDVLVTSGRILLALQKHLPPSPVLQGEATTLPGKTP